MFSFTYAQAIVETFLADLKRHELMEEPDGAALINLSYINFRTNHTENAVFYLNRGDSTEPVFPNDTGYFEDKTAVEAFKVSETEIVIVATLSGNQKDACLIALQVIGFIQAVSEETN